MFPGTVLEMGEEACSGGIDVGDGAFPIKLNNRIGIVLWERGQPSQFLVILF